MYYKYKTEIELKEITEIHSVMRSIRQVLKENRTDNIQTNGNIINFRNSSISGKLRMNIDYMTIISKGTFTIIDENSKTRIIYQSYAPILGYLVMLSIIIVIGILVDLETLFIFSFIFLICLFLEYLIIRNGSIGILKRIKGYIETIEDK
jgi:hypothetical protein